MRRTDATGAHRRRRGASIVASVAVAAPMLYAGGALARAAEASPAPPASVSVSWTGPDGQPTGPGGVTTTTTEAPRAPRAASDTGSTGATVGSGRIGVSVSPGASGGADGGATQTFQVSVQPGSLTVSPSSTTASLSNLRFFGHPTSLYRGDVAPVTVVDARGSLVGWHATVSLQSVSGVDAARLARARVCVTPDHPDVVAGNPGEVVAARRSCGQLGDALTVFFAPPQGGGGTFSDTAGLTLVVPGGTHPDQVTASLAVAVH